jgi:integral membrane protein (TIGR01906 family)
MSPGEQAGRTPSGLVRHLSKPILVCLLPILFLSTAVRLEMNSPGLYEHGFEEYEISAATRLDEAQLTSIAHRLIGYFNSTHDSPQMEVTTNEGLSFPLFHDYELVHLTDVKRLFALNSCLQSLSLLFVFILLSAAFASRCCEWRKDVLVGLRRGAAVTLLSLLVAAVLFAADFNWMFVGFHLVAFDNPFWLLDPYRDYLVMLFPLGFWQDTFVLAGIVIGLLGGTTYAATLIWAHAERRNDSERLSTAGRG